MLDLERKHNETIRREIGDRLRSLLSPEESPLPPRLRQLVHRFDDRDQHSGSEVLPSITPVMSPGLTAEPGLTRSKLGRTSFLRGSDDNRCKAPCAKAAVDRAVVKASPVCARATKWNSPIADQHCIELA